ncbi:MAG: M23 family metallopeptidase [Crocinitomicaceae bacterium]|nr:M23 family metallopeptidase [Crocinitomicaceae bacterium]
MLRKINLFLFFLSLTSAIFSQQIIDTLYTSHGTVLLYENKSWQYLEDLRFDGVMNEHLNCVLRDHPDLDLKQHWDNNVVFPSGYSNSMAHFNDTIWVCVLRDLNDEFVMPVKGIMTSSYKFRGKRHHRGVDLDLNTGDTVVAAWSGKVRYAKYNEGGFGNLVIIRHDNGLETLYAHNSKLLVAPNQYVKAGTPIALGGNTGHSFGSHLHFEVRFYDLPMNPEEIIDFENKRVRDDNLLIHRSLFIPGAKPSYLTQDNPTATAASLAVNPATSNSTNKYYKVRSGDTLSSIASRNKTTVAKICQLNGIKQTTVLQVGRNLRIR